MTILDINDEGPQRFSASDADRRRASYRIQLRTNQNGGMHTLAVGDQLRYVLDDDNSASGERWINKPRGTATTPRTTPSSNRRLTIASGTTTDQLLIPQWRSPSNQRIYAFLTEFRFYFAENPNLDNYGVSVGQQFAIPMEAVSTLVAGRDLFPVHAAAHRYVHGGGGHDTDAGPRPFPRCRGGRRGERRHSQRHRYRHAPTAYR